jgi:hypothetical protein
MSRKQDIYLCDPRLSMVSCPHGALSGDTPSSLSISLDSTEARINRLQGGTLVLRMVSGERLESGRFRAAGATLWMGGDSISMRDVGSISVSKFNFREAAEIFLAMTLSLAAVGVLLDGADYLGGGDKMPRTTVKLGVTGMVLGAIAGSVAWDRFEVVVQPIVLDTNKVPY